MPKTRIFTTAAALVIHNANTLTAKELQQIAAWLKKEAKFITSGMKFSARYRARFLRQAFTK